MRIATVFSCVTALAFVAAFPSHAQQSETQAEVEREVEARRAMELEMQVAREALATQEVERERARQELALARAQLEAAARELAMTPQANLTNLNQTRFLLNGDVQPRGRVRIGALITAADGGALITQLTPGGAAENAGLRVGDVIATIGDVELAEDSEQGDVFDAFFAALDSVDTGETVHVVVERGGEMLEFDVEPDEADDLYFMIRENMPARVEVLSDRVDDVRVTRDGLPGFAGSGAATINVVRAFGFAGSIWGEMELVPVTENLGRYFDTDEGLLVVSAPGDEAVGIEDGDVILAISGRTPNSPEHAIRILSSFEPGETIEFSLMRDRRRETIDYEVPEADSRSAPVQVFPVER